METLILFSPVVGYFIFSTIMFMFKKFKFELHASILLVALVTNFILSMQADGFILIAMIQIVFAIAAFVLMVPFFAGKASGETMLAFTAIIGLPPFAKLFGESLAGFALTLGLFLIYAILVTKKQAGGFSQIIAQAQTMQSGKRGTVSPIEEIDGRENSDSLDGIHAKTDVTEKPIDEIDDSIDDSNTSENDNYRLGVKDTLVTGLYSTWDGQLKLPDYSYLPDRDKTSTEKRVSISVYALVSYSLVALSVYIYPLLFLDR